MEKQNESGLENDNIDEDNELDLVPDIYKNEIIDYTIDPKIYEEVNSEGNEDENENNKKVMKYRIYLIVGDSQGNIKLIDLMGYIKKSN